jgi:hypothetical protein
MLVFVPLLAGLWPVAHFGIVEAKRELLEHADTLDKSAAQLKNITNERSNRPENASAKLVGDLDSAAQRARNVAEDMRHAAGRLPDYLPSAWVYAFFAALAVAAGHLVYQTSAPRTIQRYSLEEFQDEQVAHFVRNPTTELINDADNLIETAVKDSGSSLNRKVTECMVVVVPVVEKFENSVLAAAECNQNDLDSIAKIPEIQTLILRARARLEQIGAFYARDSINRLITRGRSSIEHLILHQQIALASLRNQERVFEDPPQQPRPDLLNYILDHHILVPFKPKDEYAEQKQQREKIWMAAGIQYIDDSGRRSVLSLISFAFYLAAVSLIIWLVWEQILAVLMAAGWIPSPGRLSE